MKTLVVFSHLRWDFVYQRPQHLLSRLALRWRVIFIEEPVPKAERNELEMLQPAPGVEVWRPHVTGDAPGFHDDHLPALQRLVAQAMREQAVQDYWIWFYTPMALPPVVRQCVEAPQQAARHRANRRVAFLQVTGARRGQ